MNISYEKTVLVNGKQLNLMKDNESNLYYEHLYNKDNYNVIKLITEINDETDNLTKIYAHYKRDNNNYYLTKVVNEKTLSKIVESKIKLSNSNISYLLYQILTGLKSLHDNNIIHSNLNLNTLTVDQDITVKISNFDYAFDLNTVNVSSPVDEFSAPELVKKENISFYSDIYSVGQILNKIVSYQTSDAAVIFDHIIKKCTHIDYNLRYQSVDEILKQIEHNDIVFFPPQIEQINKAKALNLSEEQIKIIANPMFNSKQMGVLKHAFDQKVSSEVIELMHNKEFSSRQMFQIMKGYEQNLSLSMLKKYAKNYYTPEEMAIYRNSLVYKYKQQHIYDRIKTYRQFTSISELDEEQLKTIRFAFYSDIKLDNLQSVLNSSLTNEQMRQIIDILKTDA